MITEVIEDYNSDRLAKMLPYKYKLMKENLFHFFRGTGHIFYEEISRSEVLAQAPPAWISGDLHIENFGCYKGRGRQVYFDINDFDDAILAPVSWDLTRFVTGLFIAFDTLYMEQARAIDMARLFLNEYAGTLAKGKADYIEYNTARGIIRKFLVSTGERKTSDFLNKFAVKKRGEMRLRVDDKKQFKLNKDLKKDLSEHISLWMRSFDLIKDYKVTDAVFHLMGISSLGLRRYAFLLRSKNKGRPKYMILDMKEASPSCILPFSNFQQPGWESQASRIVTVQERLQNKPPMILGLTNFRGRSYVVKLLEHEEDNISIRFLKDKYKDMRASIKSLATLTASSHLRSSGQDGSFTTDGLKSFAHQVQWKEDIIDFAASYCIKAKKDYDSYLAEKKEMKPINQPLNEE